MSLKLWATKRDHNEPEIVAALQAVGASVTRLSQKGVPDLAVGFKGATYFIEVKMPGAKLTPAQQEWVWTWEGQEAIVETPEQALRAIGALHAESSVQHHLRTRHQAHTDRSWRRTHK